MPGAANTVGSIMDPLGGLIGSGAGTIDALGRVADVAFGTGSPVAGGVPLFGGMQVGDSGMPAAGGIAAAGNVMSGIGKLMQDDPNWGGIGDITAGVAGAAGMIPGVASKLGPWGAVIGGGAQALSNGYEAYENFAKGDKDAGWNSTGDATLGALHAGLGSWCPVAELYISGFETGANLLGMGAGWLGGDDAKFSAGSIVGGLERGMFGDESMGSWVSDQMGGGILGGVAGGVTNAVGMPLNIADSAAGGVVNTVGNILDGFLGFGTEGRDDYWGMMKGGVANGAQMLGGAALDVAGGIGNGILDVGGGLLSGAGAVAGGIGNGILDVGGGLLSGAGDVLGGVGSGIMDVGGGLLSGIGAAGSGILGGIGDVASGIGSGFSNFAEGDVFSGLGDIAGGIGSGAWSAISGVGEGVGDVLGGIGSGILDVGGGLLDGIGSVAGGIGSGILDVGGGLLEGIGDVGGGIVDGIGSVAGGVGDAIGSVFSW